jgi:hypothetical protein
MYATHATEKARQTVPVRAPPYTYRNFSMIGYGVSSNTPGITNMMKVLCKAPTNPNTTSIFGIRMVKMAVTVTVVKA